MESAARVGCGGRVEARKSGILGEISYCRLSKNRARIVGWSLVNFIMCYSIGFFLPITLRQSMRLNGCTLNDQTQHMKMSIELKMSKTDEANSQGLKNN